MADGFRIDAAWLDALDQYIEGLQSDTAAAAEVTAQYLYEEAVDRAREEYPAWVNLADNVQAWSQDGRLHIGVQDNAMISEASTAEYGDESTPPAPLMRTMNRLVPKVQDRFERELQARRGMIPIKGMKV